MAGEPMVQYGDHGVWVTYCQRLLVVAGYSPGADDGSFGSSTHAAVLAFQTARGVPANGVVDGPTWAALGSTATAGPASEPIVVEQRRSSRDVVFGLVTLVCLAVPVRVLVWGGEHDTDDIVMTVIVSVVGILFLLLWIHLVRHPTTLEVSADAIRLQTAGAAAEPPTLLRSHSDQLVFRLGGMARSRHWLLTNALGEPVLSLQFFARRDVEEACAARGWRLG